MIKFIHCSNIRLDAPVGIPDLEKASVRRQEIKESFVKMLEAAKEKQADFILVSGNLFDGKNISPKTLEFIKEGFKALNNCKIIIAPGELDSAEKEGIYSLVDFSDNVFVLGKDENSCLCFDIRGEKVNVRSKAELVTSDGAMNILLASTALAKDNGSAELDFNELLKSGIDYCALTHPTKVGAYCDEGDMWYAYPGVCEALSFEEPSNGGYIYVEGEKNSNGFICKPKIVSSPMKKYVTLSVNVTGAQSTEMLVKALSDKLNALGNDLSGTLLKVVLSGDVAPYVSFANREIADLAAEKNAFFVKVIDNTVPLYGYEYLSGDPTVKGALYNAFRPAICSEDKNVSLEAIYAHRLGQSVLDSKDISFKE